MKVEKVLLQAFLAYIVLFIISKSLGKKQIAQLEFTDYVIGISIGSIAATMATEPEIPMYHFIIAMTIFGALDFMVTVTSRKTLFLKKLFKGKPIILIAKGRILYKNLKKSKLDLNELLSELRLKGYFFIYEIEYCVFENNGEMSILPISSNRPIVAKDMNLPDEKNNELSKEVIIDGKIFFKTLNALNKNKKWLFKCINIKYDYQLKNIILASYSKNDDKCYVYYKNDTVKQFKTK